ncbi:MAG: DoxX family protein [Actinomycetota bacterium]|nr:DoxX family protein [Actinomycetota bacterium]
MTETHPRATVPERRDLPAAILRWLLVAVFAVLAIPKLLMLSAATAPFVDAGLSEYFVAAIGVLEAAGAIGLALRQTTRLANVALILLTIGAVVFHLAVIGGSPVSAAVVLILLIVLLWLRARAVRPNADVQVRRSTNQEA